MTTLTLAEANKTYAISDLHLDHANIIKYCNRPFRSVKDMNYRLVKNWNATVNPEDTVYFLGDLCSYGQQETWLKRLTGKKVFIRGNHDKGVPEGLTRPHEVVSIDGLTMFLVHNSWDAPQDFDGWILHGHSHNHCPFIKGNMVNVSAEVIDYKPISLTKIVDSIRSYKGRWQ